MTPTHRHAEGLRILKRFAGYGAVTGLIPLPVIDGLALTGLQVKMIGELADLYDVPFNRNAVKAYVVSLISGVMPVSPIGGTVIRAVRVVPVLGPLLGIAVVPAFASALTWCVGRYFVSHFERGEDPLATDISLAKEWVRRGLARGDGPKTAAPTAGASA